MGAVDNKWTINTLDVRDGARGGPLVLLVPKMDAQRDAPKIVAISFGAPPARSGFELGQFSNYFLRDMQGTQVLPPLY